MNNKNLSIRLVGLALGCILLAGSFLDTTAQNLRWIRVGRAQTFFMDYGDECELVPFTTTDFLTWPAQYGDNQYTTRAKGVWMGATNFQDPVEGKLKSIKVIGVGPRYDPANVPLMVFSNTIRMIAREKPPTIYVDLANGTSNTLYDVPDEINPALPCDRMVVITYNTSMGVSVTKKVLAFTQQNHDSYFIHDYVFKNTGIYNTKGDVLRQTLNNFRVFFNYRYAFSGVASSGFSSTWADFGSEWGSSTESDDFGPPFREDRPDIHKTRSDSLRGFYAFYGPIKGSYGTRNPVSVTLGFDYDWGCPKFDGGGTNLNGLLGSARYAGCVTLFASKGPGSQFGVDDYFQPSTVNYFNADGTTTQTPTSQYDESFMKLRWDQMAEGHLPQSLWQAVGDERFYADWLSSDPLHPSGGQMGQGYGPFNLAPGDSVRIVFAEAVNGISWEKCREVGANWYAYYTKSATPTLIGPDGTDLTPPKQPYCVYQKAWVLSGIDSIMMTFKSARSNFRSGYTLPKAPPPPSNFTVSSGGDQILLQWTNNADSWPHFRGYEIYRSMNNVKDYRTVYTKVFDSNTQKATLTSGTYSWGDTSAIRGNDYYYYIQSKDDGTQNDLRPGMPLYSSLFLTLTTVPAHLLRASGNLLGEVRVVPNPYDIRARKWQFGEVGPYDRIMFYGLPPKCKLKIFSEDGALIWEKDHTNGAGDEPWDSKTSSGQIVVSGIYILYVEVSEDVVTTKDLIAKYDIKDEKLNVMYAKDALMFHAGDKIFTAGQSTYRKIVVIR